MLSEQSKGMRIYLARGHIIFLFQNNLIDDAFDHILRSTDSSQGTYQFFFVEWLSCAIGLGDDESIFHMLNSNVKLKASKETVSSKVTAV